MTEESRGRPARKYPPRIDATPEELARVVLNGGRPKGSVKALVLQRRISKCDVWPFVFGHERAIAVGSWQYVVRFKLVTKTTLPDKLSL